MLAPEHRLALLMCGTRRRREDGVHEAVDLLHRIDPSAFLTLAEQLRLASLLGRRLLDLGTEVDPWLQAQMTARVSALRERGGAHELLALSVLARLEQAGIRALGIKGTVLSRQLYDDPGTRTAGDIDVLVSAAELPRAIAVVEGLGWRHEPRPAGGSPLPVLHETLSHPQRPRIELHWRLHWYETQFATDALARAQRPGPHQPLIMTPADGLVALLLFYARDGFTGLRLAADAAAWWDRYGADQDAGRALAAAAAAYPPLAPALEASATLLGRLVGLPVTSRPLAPRPRLAVKLATPFPGIDDDAQVGANISLIDLLLAPPQGGADALRRELQKIPAELERPLTPADGAGAYAARAGHAARVLRRWLIASGQAMTRDRRGAWGRAR